MIVKQMALTWGLCYNKKTDSPYHHRIQGHEGLLLNDFKLVAKGETTTQL